MKKINPVISEHYRKLGKKSAAARRKKILEKAAQQAVHKSLLTERTNGV